MPTVHQRTPWFPHGQSFARRWPLLWKCMEMRIWRTWRTILIVSIRPKEMKSCNMFRLVDQWWEFNAMFLPQNVNHCNLLVHLENFALEVINWHVATTKIRQKLPKSSFAIHLVARGCTKVGIWSCGYRRVNYSILEETMRWPLGFAEGFC